MFTCIRESQAVVVEVGRWQFVTLHVSDNFCRMCLTIMLILLSLRLLTAITALVGPVFGEFIRRRSWHSTHLLQVLLDKLLRLRHIGFLGKDVDVVQALLAILVKLGLGPAEDRHRVILVFHVKLPEGRTSPAQITHTHVVVGGSASTVTTGRLVQRYG